MVREIVFYIRSLDGSILLSGQSKDWKLDIDVTTKTTSTITVSSDFQNVPIGGVIIVKMLRQKGFMTVGVITGYENNKIVFNGIDQILDGSFRMTSVYSGSSIEQDIVSQFEQIANSFYTHNIVNFSVGSGTSFYHTQELEHRYNNVKLYDWFLESFSSYRACYHIETINNQYKPQIDWHVSNNLYIFKDNTTRIKNWNVIVKPGQADKNAIDVWHRADPLNKTRWYITDDGIITNSLYTSGVREPIVFEDSYCIEDLTDGETPTNLPTDKEAAGSKLSASTYSHDISFDVDLDDQNIFNIEMLNDLGAKAFIMYKGRKYNSIFSGWTLSSNNTMITLKFGNNRSTIPALIKRMTK